MLRMNSRWREIFRTLPTKAHHAGGFFRPIRVADCRHNLCDLNEHGDAIIACSLAELGSDGVGNLGTDVW